MNSYFIKDFNIKNADTQNQKVKAILNKLCGIKNDDVLNTEFVFGIINDFGKLRFYLRSNESFTNILKKQFRLLSSDMDFENMDYDYYRNKMESNSNFTQLKLKKNNEYKILTTEPTQIFMENLLNSIYSKDDSDLTMLEIKLNPSPNNNKSDNKSTIPKKALNITLKSARFLIDSILYTDESYTSKQKQQIQTQRDSQFDFNYMTSINIGVMNDKIDVNERFKKLRNVASVFSQLNYKNEFVSSNISFNEMFSNKYNMQLQADEIYQFLYLPSRNVLDNITGYSEVNILIDRNVPNDGILIGSYEGINYCIATPNDILTKQNYKDIYIKKSSFGKNQVNNSQVIDNLCKTRLIEGVPGTGKSEIVTNIAISGLKKGIPFILIDPKFDTQKRLVESIPEKFIDNVDFLDLGDMLYPPAFNIFRRRKENDTTENTLITTNFISYMRKQFDRSWGYNIERMLQMTTDAILLDDVSTISEFYWMLTEESYRKSIISVIEITLQEPNVENKSRLKQLLKYWKDYQMRYEKNPITVNKEIETVMNKIGMFIGNRFINVIVSQRESYDFKKSGDMARSAIINIPEGIISQDNMSLLNGFITKAIWSDYQSRDDMDMRERYPVQWLIEEASTIVDEEIVGIMQKARSRRLGLSLITQTLASLNMRGANIGDIISDNCKTKLIYKIGVRDASAMIQEFSSLTVRDFTDCPDHHFYGKILLPDGKVSKPFFAKSPNLHPVLRDYDSYKQNHRSGKMTITQIEEDIDSRLERFIVADELS